MAHMCREMKGASNNCAFILSRGLMAIQISTRSDYNLCPILTAQSI
jgi:hypothetical protein